MNMVSWIPQAVLKQWYLFGWQSIVEILFVSTVCYYFCLWLRADRKKNLLFGFYAYCFVTLIAYLLELTVITQLIWLLAPATIMLFILIHQESLQKHFIVARTVHEVSQEAKEAHWLSALAQSLLVAVDNNKRVTCIIEKSDHLKPLLATQCTFNTAIQKSLLDIILASSLFDANKMIWVNHHGNLVAINATWQLLVDETWIEKEITHFEPFKQDALLLTNKTDALVFSINPHTRTCTIIAQKTIVEALAIHDALTVIKNYVYGKQPLPDNRGSYEFTTQSVTQNKSLS